MDQQTLPMEENKQYYGLFDEMSVIIGKINELDKQIHQMEGRPLIRNEKMDKVKNLAIDVQGEINEWRHKALEFRRQPVFKFPGSNPYPEISALHYENVLSDYIRLIDSQKFTFAWSIALIDFGATFKDSNRKWKLSFWIGISIAAVSNIPQIMGMF